jgi:tRNA modification GTPase
LYWIENFEPGTWNFEPETMLVLDDTIAAVATPPGRGAARAIVRISGPSALDCMRACFQPSLGWPDKPVLSPRVLSGEIVPLRLPCDAYVWPSRRSYTRQGAVELHIVGSPPLVAAVLRTVCQHGARLAQPGEFTLRAFLAGRLDLTQAEAVLGIIDARDRRSFEFALDQLAGGLSGPLGKLRCDLLDLVADLEAGLDFSEEHIEFVTAEEVARRLAAATIELESLAATLLSRSITAELPRVSLIGWPNTGKSSLFNALVGNERSLISARAGTTRDYVQATIAFRGAEWILVDTAGIEMADNQAASSSRFEEAAVKGSHATTIADAAQRMSKIQFQQADLRLMCLDATRPLNNWEQERLRQDPEAMVVLTKCDRTVAHTFVSADPPVGQTFLSASCKLSSLPAVRTSALSGAGLDELRQGIAARLSAESCGYAVASTAARCRSSIEKALECLRTAAGLAEKRAGDELIAAETRLALDELGKVTGAVYTEDLLDRIFSRFCIGK